MKALIEPRTLRGDIFKLAGLFVVLFASCAVIFTSPSLASPTSVSLVLTLLLSPVVEALERKGLSRSGAIGVVFFAGALLVGLPCFLAAHTLMSQWDTLKLKAPQYFEATLAQIQGLEAELSSRYPVIPKVDITTQLNEWGAEAGHWFIRNGAGLMGAFFTHLFIVPLLTFAFLKDGRALMKRVFEHVPNRFFETTFMVTSRITNSLSDFIQAKVVEAALVGLLTSLGLLAVGCPYSLVLGAIAGFGNVIPYVGPVLGAVPSLIVAWMDPALRHLIWPVVGVHVAANLIDTIVIFPVVVGKLVNLHPVVMILVVILGGQFYGLVGMLVSIPAATAIKIVFQEIQIAVQDRTSRARTNGLNLG